MELKILDATVSLFIELDKKKLVIKEDGTGRLIINSATLREPTVTSIVVIELNKRYTNYLKKFNPQGKVLFIEGTYQVLKNKKDVPFMRVNPLRILEEKKKKFVNADRLRSKLREEFIAKDIQELKEKYKELCIDAEIEELKEIIQNKEMLNAQKKINHQELLLKRYEAKELKRKRVEEQERQQREKKEKKAKNELIGWYNEKELEEFIDIDVNKIELVNDIFNQGKAVIDLKNIKNKDINDYVVIKAIDNEKYELIMGIKAYIRAKVLNKTVKALITELDRESFIESIKDKNNK